MVGISQVQLDDSLQELNGMLRKVINISGRNARELVRKMVIQFAYAAARYTDPNYGSLKIKNPYRSIRQIRPLDTGLYPLDYAMYNKGYRYVAEIKRSKYFYTYLRSDDVSRYSYIKGRGSAKYGWLQARRAMGVKVESINVPDFPYHWFRERIMDHSGCCVIHMVDPDP